MLYNKYLLILTEPTQFKADEICFDSFISFYLTHFHGSSRD